MLVHADRGGEHAGADVADVGELEQALDRAVLAERAVQDREDDVDLAEHRRDRARLEHLQLRSLRGRRQHDLRPGGSGDLRQPVRAQLPARGSSEATTHRPSRVIPTGITSYLSRSIAFSTPAAVAAEIACSPERPPNSSATRTLRAWLMGSRDPTEARRRPRRGAPRGRP